MPNKTKQNDTDTIGGLIRHTRKRRQIEVDDIAEKCNVTSQRVYQWEVSDYILEKNLSAIAAALNIPLSRLKAVNIKKRNKY